MDVIGDKIEIHIEELVLDGFDGVDSAAVGAAVRRELARLLSSPSPSAQWTSGARGSSVDGGRVSLSTNPTAQTLGTHVAQSIKRGLES